MRFASIGAQKHPVALGQIPLNALDMSNMERQWWRTGPLFLGNGRARPRASDAGKYIPIVLTLTFLNYIQPFDKVWQKTPTCTVRLPCTIHYNHKGRNMPWGSPDACSMKAWGRDSRADMWFGHWYQVNSRYCNMYRRPIRREDSDLDTCQCWIKSIDRGELDHWKSVDVHGDGVIVSTGSDDPSRLSMPVRDTHLATY